MILIVIKIEPGFELVKVSILDSYGSTSGSYSSIACLQFDRRFEQFDHRFTLLFFFIFQQLALHNKAFCKCEILPSSLFFLNFYLPNPISSPFTGPSCLLPAATSNRRLSSIGFFSLLVSSTCQLHFPAAPSSPPTSSATSRPVEPC